MSKNSDTHFTCSKHLKVFDSKATCCDCYEQKDCENRIPDTIALMKVGFTNKQAEVLLKIMHQEARRSLEEYD